MHIPSYITYARLHAVLVPALPAKGLVHMADDALAPR